MGATEDGSDAVDRRHDAIALAGRSGVMPDGAGGLPRLCNQQRIGPIFCLPFIQEASPRARAADSFCPLSGTQNELG